LARVLSPLGGDLIQKKSHSLIPGFHGVREALIHERTQIKEIWVAEGKKTARIGDILRIAEEASIPVLSKKNTHLSHLLPGIPHQGIVALVEEFTYLDLDQLADIHGEKNALLIALDHITDEGNLGAIIRTAVFFGVHGLIIPKDRSAGISPKVLKRSSGAYVYLPITRVVNMGRALDFLNKRGFWIIGASGESQDSIYEFDWNRNVVVVLGNEHRGLSQSVRKRCHQLVSIPVSGHAESLNVSVAGGVILSEIARQRNC